MVVVSLLASVVFFLIHAGLNGSILGDRAVLPFNVLAGFHVFVSVLFLLVNLLGNFIRKKLPDKFGLILSFISMFKVFIAVIFLTLVVKKTDLNRVVLILHFMSVYLLTLYFFLFQLVKYQKKSVLH